MSDDATPRESAEAMMKVAGDFPDRELARNGKYFSGAAKHQALNVLRLADALEAIADTAARMVDQKMPTHQNAAWAAVLVRANRALGKEL